MEQWQEVAHTKPAALVHGSTKAPPESWHSLASPEAMDSLHTAMHSPVYVQMYNICFMQIDRVVCGYGPHLSLALGCCA